MANSKPPIETIQEEIINSEIPLSAIFLKVRVLAHYLKNDEFSQWLKHERDGYPNLGVEELKKILPEYRIIPIHPTGDMINGFNKFSNTPIPLHHMPDWFQDMVTRVFLIQGVKALEHVAYTQEAGYFSWSHKEIAAWNQITRANGETVQLIAATTGVPAGQFSQILDGIRGRLQDFILELSENEWVLKDPSAEAQVIKKLVQNYIFQEEVTMSTFDQRGQQVNAQNNAARDVNISGGMNTQTQGSINFVEVADQLSTLLKEMKTEATETEHFVALGEVAKAEQAAKAEDSEGVLSHLKQAGKWSLDVATRIGASLAAEIIAQATGIKPA